VPRLGGARYFQRELTEVLAVEGIRFLFTLPSRLTLLHLGNHNHRPLTVCMDSNETR